MPKGVYVRTAKHNASNSASKKGIIQTAEVKARKSAAMKGHIISLETREKISVAMKDKPKTLEHCVNISAGLTGIRLTPEHRANIGFAQIGKKHTPEHLANYNATMKLKRQEPEYRAKISVAMKGKQNALGYHHTEEHNANHSAFMKGKQHTLGYHFTEEQRANVSAAEKLKWENPEFRNKKIKAMMAGMHISPNKPETLLLKLANIACHNEYQFTGDGSIVIDGLCPDLFNCNGKKKVILMHGDYWHKGENEQVTIDRYSKFGYSCLIVWENELKDSDKVITKIKQFNNSKSHSNWLSRLFRRKGGGDE